MIIIRTPFRISFFGGGTDYPAWFRENGGAVLATSIDKYCYLTTRYLPPFFEHKHRIVYSKIEMVKRPEELQHPVLRAVLTEMAFDKGLEIHHDGDLPARAGLGSSSSFTVGILHALNALGGRMVSKEELCREAIRIEQDMIKENVGCQDQATAAHGGFNRIAFLPDGTIDVSPIVLLPDKLERFQNSLMLFYTGRTRYASEIAGEQIRNMKDRAEELHAMRAMVDEAIGILSGDNDIVKKFGNLLHETWTLKRRLADSVSNTFIDEIYEAGRAAGAFGGKLLGAGSGGFMLFVVPLEKQAAVRKRLSSLLHVRFRFETGGSRILVYEPNWNNGD